MESAVTVGARFLPSRVRVSKEGNGEGIVVSSPDGIECGDACTSAFAPGSAVTLSALPSEHSRFLKWSAGCDDVADDRCVVSVDRPRDVSAEFGLMEYLLSVHPKRDRVVQPNTRAAVRLTGR